MEANNREKQRKMQYSRIDVKFAFISILRFCVSCLLLMNDKNFAKYAKKRIRKKDAILLNFYKICIYHINLFFNYLLGKIILHLNILSFTLFRWINFVKLLYVKK